MRYRNTSATADDTVRLSQKAIGQRTNARKAPMSVHHFDKRQEVCDQRGALRPAARMAVIFDRSFRASQKIVVNRSVLPVHAGHNKAITLPYLKAETGVTCAQKRHFTAIGPAGRHVVNGGRYRRHGGIGIMALPSAGWGVCAKRPAGG